MVQIRAREHLTARWPLLAAALLVAVACGLSGPSPPARSERGVAAMLGRAMGGIVDEHGFVWEPSRGWLLDALLGRDVLFVGASEPGAPRDVYRARIRVSREGRPLSLLRVTNLSRTPLGDEGQLSAANRFVAFSTRSGGAVQGVTVLDLGRRAGAAMGWYPRLIMMVDNRLELGTWRGLSRAELVFGKRPASIAMELRQGRLILALGERRLAAAWELSSMRLDTGPENVFDAAVYRPPTRAKRLAHLIIDGLRELLGTGPADTFEALLFEARGQLLRAVLALRPRQELAATEHEPTAAADWPPAPLEPIFRHHLAGEGQWRPPPVRWLPKAIGMVGTPAPYLYQTVIRPDPDAPFARVRLVAIDTRQLELHVEAGFDEPRPLTGPRGRGRIAEQHLRRVVAAFNGAFQRRHGSYGMMVEGRVLLPPKRGAATVAIDATGRSFLGPWSDTLDARSYRSLRQNLDPLLDDGKINPAGRTHWGFALSGQSYLTERSALCRTAGGYLMYGWGIELSAHTLALGLVRAGCREAMHLDINPGHVGFSYLNAARAPAKAALLAPEMSIAPRRFVEASPKDFFYLVLRDPTPHAGDLVFEPDGAAQPPPTWLPAVHRAKSSLLGVELEVLAFDLGRFRWQVRAGKHERAASTAEGGLSPATLARTLAAIGLGVAKHKGNRRGLVLDGVATLPIRPGLGLLSTDPQGGLRIARSVESLVLPEDGSEAVLLAENGGLRSEARALGTLRARAAACQLGAERLLIAIGRGDSVEAHTRTLLAAGCTRVVSLDRGHQVAAFVHRAGSPTPPRASYDDTVLYAAAGPSGGRARRLAPAP